MSSESEDSRSLHYAAIVESSDDAIVAKDLQGTIVAWNSAAERIFGYVAAEVIGKSITVIIPADRLAEETEVLTRIRRGEMVSHYETIRRRKDGTFVPISLTVSPVRNAEGRIIGASKVARDITDRRRAEAALAETEQRHRDLQQRLIALAEASGKLFGKPSLEDVQPRVLEIARALIPADAYAVWRLTGDGWHIGASSGVSEGFLRIIMPPHSTHGASTVPFSEPLLAEEVAAEPLLASRVEAYRTEGIESVMIVPLVLGGRPSGTVAFYYRHRHSFTAVEVQTSRALAAVAAAAIETAELYDRQRHSREQAQRANRRAAFLAEVSTALSESLDYETTLRRVAALAVPRIADWCAVDIVSEHGAMIQRLAVAHVDPAKIELARRLHEEYPEDPDAPRGIRAVINSGQPVMISEVTPEMIRAAARDPEHLRILEAASIVSYIAVPLVAHGRTFGALSFISAESGRHYTDADLQLAQDVAYRSAIAVENARAYEQAAAANRAKDEFLATLSHELRTPLNAVLGWIRMLRAGHLAPAKIPGALEVIERNASNQLRLVEDLLDLSRIITGKFRLDIQPIDVSAGISAAVEAIHPAATAKDITVTVDRADGADVVLGDAARLQQAVWNLLSNAIKFTPRGGRVAVAVRREGAQVQIKVSDTGEGIAADLLPYVFDRFRQGDSGTTRAHMGLGLGLAIVRHIIELHGGSVGVTSRGPGCGATFALSLPAAKVEQADQTVPADPNDGAAHTRLVDVNPALDRVRVLVVDDDPDARDLLHELLEPRGMHVVSVGSVLDALVEFDRATPDILISDIAMAGEDGFDLIRRVRARPSESGGAVPAIALSAYARPEDGVRSISSGFQLHLAKPVDVEKLEAAVISLAGAR